MKYTWLLKLSNEFLNSYKDKLQKEKFEDEIKHFNADIEDVGYDPEDPNIDVDDRKVLLKNDIVPVEPGFYNRPYKQKKYNYQPSDFGHHTSLLGQGGLSRVVRVVWKHKPAVAKITVAKNDFSKMLNFTKLKDKVPNEFKKHIPIIYDYFFDEKSKRYIIIMEELNSINIHVKNKFTGRFNLQIFYKRLEKFIQNLDRNIKDILLKTNSRFSKDNKINENDCIKIIEYVKNNISKLFNIKNDQDLTEFQWKFRIELKNFLTGLNIFPWIIDDFLSEFTNMFIENTTVREFPREYNDGYDYKETVETPELKSLYDFLVYLKDNLGIKWSDMHASNIMERPGTRDLVISDPGEFIGL